MTDDTQTPQAEYVTVNTVEELEALPNRTAFIDAHGDVGVWQVGLAHYPETTPFGSERTIKRYGPLTVLTPAPTPQTPDDVRAVNDEVFLRELVEDAHTLAWNDEMECTDAPRQITEAIIAEGFTRCLSAIPKPRVNAETHSEETLRKVYRALERAGVYGIDARDAVTEMQNEGILFRERAAEVEVES